MHVTHRVLLGMYIMHIRQACQTAGLFISLLQLCGLLQGVSGKVKARMEAAANGTDGGARPMLLFPEVRLAAHNLSIMLVVYGVAAHPLKALKCAQHPYLSCAGDHF